MASVTIRNFKLQVLEAPANSDEGDGDCSRAVQLSLFFSMQLAAQSAADAADILTPRRRAAQQATATSEEKASLVDVQILGSVTKTPAWLLVTTVLCSLTGIVPTIILLVIFNSNGGTEAPCEAPIAWWIWLTAIINIPAAAIGAITQISTLLYGKKDEETGLVVKPPAFARGLDCLALGFNIFSTYWFIRGNQFVFGSYPMSEAAAAALASNVTVPLDTMADGNIAAGLGCAPGLWYGARAWVIVQYAMFGIAILLIFLACCCVCCLMAGQVARMQQEQEMTRPAQTV